MAGFLGSHRFMIFGCLVLFCFGTFLGGCGGDKFLDQHLDLDLQGFAATGASTPVQPVLTHTPANPRGRP